MRGRHRRRGRRAVQERGARVVSALKERNSEAWVICLTSLEAEQVGAAIRPQADAEGDGCRGVLGGVGGGPGGHRTGSPGVIIGG